MVSPASACSPTHVSQVEDCVYLLRRIKSFLRKRVSCYIWQPSTPFLHIPHLVPKDPVVGLLPSSHIWVLYDGNNRPSRHLLLDTTTGAAELQKKAPIGVSHGPWSLIENCYIGSIASQSDVSHSPISPNENMVRYIVQKNPDHPTSG